MTDFHMGILETELAQRIAYLDLELEEDHMSESWEWIIRGQLIALGKLAAWVSEFNGYYSKEDKNEAEE
jgi:hypothetical protein